MALQTVSGYVYYPPLRYITPSTNIMTSLQVAATVDSTNKAAIILQIPKTGSIYAIAWHQQLSTTPVGTVTVSLKAIDTSGNPTATDYGGSTGGSEVSFAAYRKYITVLSAPATATAGGMAAVVWEFSGTGSIGLYMGGGGSNAFTASSFPYSATYNGTTWTKSPDRGFLGLQYTNSSGTWENCNSEFSYGTQDSSSYLTTLTYTSSSSPNEYALKFVLPFKARLVGYWAIASINSAATYSVNLYEGSDGTAKLTSETMSGAVSGVAGSPRYRCGFFSSSYVCSAGTEYRLGYKALNTNNMSVYRIAMPSTPGNAMLGILPGGTALTESSRTGTGAWTDTDYNRPYFGLILDQLGDDVGGAVVNPGIKRTSPPPAIIY
jgi:hypothetical protein